MVRHVIAPVDELPPGTRKFLTIDERPIAVFNINGEFFGLLNRCPHQGAALCEGPLIGLAQSSDPGEIEYTRLGEIIRCPWHGWEFDIRTGQSYRDPEAVSRQDLSRQRRAGRQRGEGAVCCRDHQGRGGKRLRGGGSLTNSSFRGASETSEPQMCNCTSGNLEIPRCAIAHLRSGPSDHPGMMNMEPRRFHREPDLYLVSALPMAPPDQTCRRHGKIDAIDP